MSAPPRLSVGEPALELVPGRKPRDLQSESDSLGLGETSTSVGGLSVRVSTGVSVGVSERSRVAGQLLSCLHLFPPLLVLNILGMLQLHVSKTLQPSDADEVQWVTASYLFIFPPLSDFETHPQIADTSVAPPTGAEKKLFSVALEFSRLGLFKCFFFFFYSFIAGSSSVALPKCQMPPHYVASAGPTLAWQQSVRGTELSLWSSPAPLEINLTLN